MYGFCLPTFYAINEPNVGKIYYTWRHMGTRSKMFIYHQIIPLSGCAMSPDLLVVRCGKVHVQSLAKM